jgi:hypothetical protein
MGQSLRARSWKSSGDGRDHGAEPNESRSRFIKANLWLVIVVALLALLYYLPK